MKRIAVDRDARTVRAEPGLTWGEFDAATQEHGLAVTGGRVSETGIAGLALGSGSGWLERKLGFTCDNLIRAEVVTADGRKVVACDDENADLFWGLRGGGGNFGIVTAFHVRLHAIGPMILGGMLLHAADMAGEVVRFYRDFMQDAPDEVGGALAFIAEWSRGFEVPGQEPDITLDHVDCGNRLKPILLCDHCWRPLLRNRVQFGGPVQIPSPPPRD
jgi:FAD/FMN-containing dehydrogenase